MVMAADDSLFPRGWVGFIIKQPSDKNVERHETTTAKISDETNAHYTAKLRKLEM